MMGLDTPETYTELRNILWISCASSWFFFYLIISRCTVNKTWYIDVNRTGDAKQIETLNNFKPCNLSRLRPYFLFIIMVEMMQTSHESTRTITNIKHITGMSQEYFFLNRKVYSFWPTLMLSLRIFAFCYRPDWGTLPEGDGCSSQHFQFCLRPNEPVAPSMRSPATHCWHNVSTLKYFWSSIKLHTTKLYKCTHGT